MMTVFVLDCLSQMMDVVYVLDSFLLMTGLLSLYIDDIGRLHVPVLTDDGGRSLLLREEAGLSLPACSEVAGRDFCSAISLWSLFILLLTLIENLLEAVIILAAAARVTFLRASNYTRRKALCLKISIIKSAFTHFLNGHICCHFIRITTIYVIGIKESI